MDTTNNIDEVLPIKSKKGAKRKTDEEIENFINPYTGKPGKVEDNKGGKKRGRKPNPKKNYLSTFELASEIQKYQETGTYSVELHAMFELMIGEISSTFHYTGINASNKYDCQANAAFMCWKYSSVFNINYPEKAFSYFTRVISTAMAAEWNRLMKPRKMKVINYNF